ncbi:MAG: hypothetical protein ACREUM_06540, partial [Nitrosospira sp.]
MKDAIAKGRKSGVLRDNKDNEWETAESFLFGRIRERHLLVKEKSIKCPVSIRLGNRKIPCYVVVTAYEQYNVMLLTLCATILDLDTGASFSYHRFDEVIAVLQSLHGAPSLQGLKAEKGHVTGLHCDVGYPSVYDAVRQAICTLVELRDLPGSMKRKGWCI